MAETKLGKRYDLYGQPAPILGRGRVTIQPSSAAGAFVGGPTPAAGAPSVEARDAEADAVALQQVAAQQLHGGLHQLFNGQIPGEYLQALQENPDWDAEDFVRVFGSHLLQNYMIHPNQLFELIGAGP